MGRRVRSVVAWRAEVAAGWREEAPPEVRERDMVSRSRRREGRLGDGDGMVACVFLVTVGFFC